MTVEHVHELTSIDPWFLSQMRELVEAEREYAARDEAHVRELQRNTLGVNRTLARWRSGLATSVQEQKTRAVAAFMEAERNRLDLSFFPSIE